MTSLVGPRKDEVDFIDKFIIPAGAIDEFHQRTTISRSFLKTLPGFMADAVYERKDEQGNLICVTIARWANMEAVSKAKEAVQEEYKREGFDPMAMMKRLNIMLDRGLYTPWDGQ
jgi:heme-degrading monooxygenase HmoA